MHAVLTWLAEHPEVLLFALVGAGMAVGHITVRKISLGAAAVLFVAIAVSALGASQGVALEIPVAFAHLGLGLFTFSVGVSSGANFVAAQRLRARFGPVATVMPYETADEAVALARRGRGCLVSSLFTHDSDIAAEIAHGLAPWHGRVLVSNRVSAKSSTGHGSPLPTLLHGGPGRAGGGEELGGVRAVGHYMQRTALQGPPEMIARIAGRWLKGAPVRHGVHPFRKTASELEIGDQLVTESRVVTLDDIEHFARFTGDTFYAHMDEEAAAANPFFDGRVAHGYLIVSFAAGLFVQPDPGPVLANFGIDHLRFMKPVNPDDCLQVTLTCKEINPREADVYAEVRWDTTVTNQNGEVVAQYDVLTLVAKNWSAERGSFGD